MNSRCRSDCSGRLRSPVSTSSVRLRLAAHCFKATGFSITNWFQYYDELPRKLTQITISWDMAFKNKPENDYVVGLVGGCDGANRYIMDRVKGQWSFSQTCKQVERLAQKYPEATIVIEDTANGPAIIDTLTPRVGRIVAVQPDGGKLARAHAVQPLVEGGNVFLPNPRPHGRLLPERAWVEDFVHQLITFPYGAHDDDVDAFTQLLLRLRRKFYSCVW
jgi:predicted phage terminase large subunit-like protein